MTLTARDQHLPFGQAASDLYTVDVDPARAGWVYSGLRVLALDAGTNAGLHTGRSEVLVVPLSGGCTVSVDGHGYELQGRDSVFTGVTDSLYIPRDSEVVVHTDRGGRFALASAECEQARAVAYLPAADVPVELRGAGQASRQVHNFCSPEAFEADRLIAVEVLTPGGNWSSYPPHKHDEEIPGVETALEEIYYFEVARDGFGYQRAYGRGIDICREVRTGDVVLLPRGYHGPSMAAPGYDLYYLNVMAGPGERAWRFTDDPAHAWIRASWAEQELDPRLPLTSSRRHA